MEARLQNAYVQNLIHRNKFLATGSRVHEIHFSVNVTNFIWFYDRNCLSNSRRTTCGLALPAAFFITCPNKKFNTVSFPDL